MIKEKEVMDKIKQFAIQLCNKEFGYTGLAEQDTFVMVNSGKEGSLIMKIEVKE